MTVVLLFNPVCSRLKVLSPCLSVLPSPLLSTDWMCTQGVSSSKTSLTARLVNFSVFHHVHFMSACLLSDILLLSTDLPLKAVKYDTYYLIYSLIPSGEEFA